MDLKAEPLNPRIARIHVYPIKSLDGMGTAEARILPSGALENDRRFALHDGHSQCLRAKQFPMLHRLRVNWKPQPLTGTFAMGPEDSPTIRLDDRDQRRKLAVWLGRHLQQELQLCEEPNRGFPDDTHAPGPTLISTATLKTIASWFEGMEVDEVRRRFRTNIEIEGVPAFWEDRLFTADDSVGVPFRLGEVQLIGQNPCQRCAVPARNSQSGEPDEDFARLFRQRRQETLPAWAASERFDHFYRVAINTGPPSGFQGGILRLGDTLRLDPIN